MSVYTELTQSDIEALLSRYSLGQYRSHKGISAGVENTNYFVTTDDHELVLTLFEKHTFDELPFFLQLGEHLHNEHCKVPQPFRSQDGEFLQRVKNKPAVFIEKLTGHHVQADADTAAEIARAMADIHLATQHFEPQREHSHGISWVLSAATDVRPQLTNDDQQLLDQAITLLKQLPANLPRGVIHADLFHDNALFNDGLITGIIDWYFAGTDSYTLDIAIAMNDWCLNSDGHIDLDRCEAFIDAYQTHRPLNEDELNSVGLLQIQAATRFWLSRWQAQQEHQQSNDNITVKDPQQMKALLVQLLNYTV